MMLENGVDQFIECDCVVYACGNRANDISAFEGIIPWFVPVGDCNKRARTCKQATYEGFCAAMDII